MILGFGSLAQGTANKSQIIMSVARIFITHQRGFQMFRGYVVFTASIKGQTERDMRRSEDRIALQCFEVGLARFPFFTLFVESETFDIALLSARRIPRIGNRTRGGIEVRIVIDGGIGSVAEQYPTIPDLECKLKW